MEFRFAPFVISTVIGVVLFAALLLPIISDATATEKTFDNDGYYEMSKYTTEDISMSFDHTSPGVVIVNDAEVSLPSSLGVNVSIVASDIFCIRYNTDGSFQCFSGNSNTSASTSNDWTFVATGGTATFTNTTTSATRTAEYDSIYVITNEGDWTMKQSTIPAYMNGDSFFMGVGLTSGSSAIGIVGLNVSGSVDDGATINVWRGGDLTFTNVTLVEEAVNNYVDLYSLDRVTFTATDSESNSLDIVYSYFIVPDEITAEKTQHMSDTEIALTNVIPVLVIVGLIIGIVYVVGRRAELF